MKLAASLRYAVKGIETRRRLLCAATSSLRIGSAGDNARAEHFTRMPGSGFSGSTPHWRLGHDLWLCRCAEPDPLTLFWGLSSLASPVDPARIGANGKNFTVATG
jgi:hypothetical protein